jgi:hypothetical protein
VAGRHVRRRPADVQLDGDVRGNRRSNGAGRLHFTRRVKVSTPEINMTGDGPGADIIL